MRSFVGIELSLKAKEEIQTIQSSLSEVDEGVFRQLSSDTFHLTLYFLGEATPESLVQVKSGLNNLKAQQMNLKLGKILKLPKPDVPRVLSIEIEGEADKLHQLQRRIADVMFPLDVFKETRAYLPHITFARLKKEVPANAKIVKRSLAQLHSPQKVEWKVEEFCLYKSELTPEGAVYSLIDRYPLA